MLIDWFTVVAQTLNFLVLVLLLKFVLYDRIVRAVDQRQGRIAARLAKADLAEQQAEAERARLQECRAELEREHRSILEDAKADAERQRQQWLAQARVDADDGVRRWLESLQERRAQFSDELRRRVAHGSFEAAQLVLRQLGDANLEQQVVQMFLRKLAKLQPGDAATLTDMVREGGGTVVVASAHDLPAQLQEQVTASLRAQVGDVRVHYVQAPELICGIEVRSQGHVFGWNMAAYAEEVTSDIETFVDGVASRVREASPVASSVASGPKPGEVS